MLESFVNSQKHSVKMALRRTFRSYIVRPEDNFGLIMYQLKEMVREHLEMMTILGPEQQGETITFKATVQQLEERVQQVGVTNVMPFLESQLFKDNKFSYDPETQTISRVFLSIEE